ncbi:glycoside hydrolase family 97 N-terminal domain-containing protein [Sphingomonas sp. LR60]|uniref:glycoside hydrolase family 97 N-terminal domain-containing protein n=1 Tax=Sphingomonas sp. LR60 TaxID=3050233 RepID=UPI002FE2D4EF
MLRRSASVAAIVGMALALPLSAAQAKSVTVASPDGKVQAIVSDTAGKLSYRVTVDGQPILNPSPIGMRVDGVELGEGAVARSKTDSRYRFNGGKAEAVDRANVATVTLTTHGTRLEADVHVADDGVGVRLRLPAKPEQMVEADRSGWKLAAPDPRVWVTRIDPGYEQVYENRTLREIKGRSLGLPLTARIGRYYVTLSEAAVVNYGDSALSADASGMLNTFLYVDPMGWTTDAPVVQPWRVTIIARDLTGLVNSTLVQNLNPPPLQNWPMRTGFVPASPAGSGWRPAAPGRMSSTSGSIGPSSSATLIIWSTKDGRAGSASGRRSKTRCATPSRRAWASGSGCTATRCSTATSAAKHCATMPTWASSA